MLEMSTVVICGTLVLSVATVLARIISLFTGEK